MKKRIILSFLLFQSLAFGQIANWYKVDLSRLGYKRTTFTFENYPVGNGVTPSFSTTEIKGGSFEFSADLYAKYLYFSVDGSSLLDIGATLFQFNKSKQRWFDNDQYSVLRSDILPIRLAFGRNIGKYFALYAGGQYSLSSVGLQYKNSQNLRNTRIGGNTYGFGGHAVAAYKFMNVRYSYMYNWQSQANLFKGNGITNELVVSVGKASVGVFAKFTHFYNTTHAGFLPEDRTKLFGSKYNGKPSSWQSSHTATQFQFSVGIYAAGLFSGISNAGARAISETEQGVAKERREEKRRKVEWKD